MKPSPCFLVLLAAAMASVPALHAQFASEDLSLFGQLGQGNAAVTGPQALRNNTCVPTSVANGLTYLENYSNFVLDEPSPFTVSPNNYTAVNKLITAMDTDTDGTAYSDKFNGLQQYLSPTGANPAPTVRVFGQASPQSRGGVPAVNAGIALQGVNPTLGFLISCLQNHDAVELGLQWGAWNSDGVFNARGGHSVTLDSIRYDASTNSGMIGMIDPWSANTISNNGGTAAGDYSVSFQIIRGFLYLSWPTTVASNGMPPEDVGPIGGQDLGTEASDLVLASGQQARVLNVVVEAIPDAAATWLLSLLGIGAILSVEAASRRFRRAN